MNGGGMKYFSRIFFFIINTLIAQIEQSIQISGTMQETLLMDFGWHFHLGNAALAGTMELL